VIFGRSKRFHDLVRRQLDVFAEDEADLLAEAETADQAWTRAGREAAEELYGDYQLVVDAIADRLLDVRETYAATLGDDAVDEYRDVFTRAATKRYRRFAGLLAEA
jgi:NTP pyrophosphatase (non-canonical NTP hydrolase)